MKDRIYKILLVDDEKNVLNTLFWNLKTMPELKCELVKANCGDEALALMEKDHYDLIISDHRMPEMTGVILLEKVKKQYPNMKKILLTGCSDLSIVKEAVNRAKIDRYLEKPWDINDLRENVCSILNEISEDQENQMISPRHLLPDEIVKQVKLSSKELRDNNKEEPVKMMFEFNSTGDLNTFTKLAEDLKFLKIEKVDSFDNKYVISICVYPEYRISFLQE